VSVEEFWRAGSIGDSMTYPTPRVTLSSDQFPKFLRREELFKRGD